MPIDEEEEDGGLPVVAQQERIPHRVRSGLAVPILSHAAIFDLALFGHDAFVRYYARKIGYPPPYTRDADHPANQDRDANQKSDYPYPGLPDVGHLANYDRYTNQKSDIDCNEFYLNCIKNHIYREARAAGADSDALKDAKVEADSLGVSEFAHRLGYPKFDQASTRPLLMLAELPFKTYLTVSITTFLEDALREFGKTPVTKMCRWRGPVEAPSQDLWQIPDSYQPSVKQPLVYHLCGLDAHPDTKVPLPDSLALTQENHLELLVNLAQDRGKENIDRLPALVRGALSDTVLLLGFSLDSWAFRALYYGLVRQTGQEGNRRGVCCVQLPPEERATQEKYLEGYLDKQANLDIYWGSIQAYIEALKKP